MPKTMSNPHIPRTPASLDGFIERYELTIRERLKAKCDYSEFSVRQLYERYRRRANKLRRAGRKSAKHLHASFSGLDRQRKSAACPFEAIRLRLWLLTEVYKRLAPDLSYLVTLANPKWSRPQHNLPVDWSAPVARKIRSAVTQLEKGGHPVKGVAVIELCLDRDLDGGLSWSPHFHMVISGADLQALREAFAVRLPAGRRGIDKPLQISPIKSGELGHVLSYISKMKPELRSAYTAENGRKRRRRNHLPKELLPSWLTSMADRSITEMVVHFGQGPDIARRFRLTEMSIIIGELL